MFGDHPFVSVPSRRQRRHGLGVVVAVLVVIFASTAAVIASTGPTITSFGAIEGSNRYWSFEGQVTDPNPSSCIVYFGGIPSLEGKSTKCSSDGSFLLVVQLQPGENGTATAQAVDSQGLSSNIAWTIVYQSY